MANGKLIVIAGPTAVGKTALSIELAQLLNTEIISADSRQFYRELNIGTAKPDSGQLATVPHHFINNLSIKNGEKYTASIYEKEVLDLLESKFKEHSTMIMTGGSGLFIDAVINGFDEAIPAANQEVRLIINSIYNEKGIEGLQSKLKEHDPEYYQIVDLQNAKRLMRAIEVCMVSGKPYSSLRKGIVNKRPFEIQLIGLEMDRDELYQRINKRVDEMVDNGLEEEVRSLKEFRNMNALKTVGYTEFFNYFDGLYTLDGAIEKIKVNSRRYAKRQLTWFKKNPNYNWFKSNDKEDIIKHLQHNDLI